VTTTDDLITGIRRRAARVLVVDDELGITRLLERALSSEFLETATNSPLDALASVTSGARYDVIVSDVMMPKMTGVELHDRIQAVDAGLSARMVFMTGGVPDERLADRLAALPNTVLAKPLDVGGLRELLRRRVQADRARHGASA